MVIVVAEVLVAVVVVVVVMVVLVVVVMVVGHLLVVETHCSGQRRKVAAPPSNATAGQQYTNVLPAIHKRQRGQQDFNLSIYSCIRQFRFQFARARTALSEWAKLFPGASNLEHSAL